MMKEENQSKKFDLEDRLVDFAVRIARIVESLPNTRTGNHIAGQLIRSGTSPALNYGEAQSAESRSDFIHKIKIVLKELRESFISLKIIQRLSLVKVGEKVESLMDEANQLIAIFVKSISTAQSNKTKK
jgi:four helix bundle protein